jgi:TRAP-type uncharacterized transport system substrate-binding protein
MESGEAQKIAIVAAIAAIFAVFATGRLPRWLRVSVVLSLAFVACAAGLFSYRYATHPVTLTVATGSIAARMAATESPVRLKVVDKGTALDAINAFAAGETDLAVARADLGDLSAARTVVLMTYEVVLIAVPQGSAIDGVDGLKGKAVGVIAANANQQLISAITKAYDLDRTKLNFKEVTPSEAAQALQSKQVNALLVVMPICRGGLFGGRLPSRTRI